MNKDNTYLISFHQKSKDDNKTDFNIVKGGCGYIDSDTGLNISTKDKNTRIR